jgi:DnaJ-class molecular chaperone
LGSGWLEPLNRCSTASYNCYVGSSAADKVCPHCKGVGLVSAPAFYAMPMKAVRWVTCALCRAKERMAEEASARRSR